MPLKLLDHGLPIGFLKERRRELAEAMMGDDPPTLAQLQELAVYHQAIAALEAVKGEMDQE